MVQEERRRRPNRLLLVVLTLGLVVGACGNSGDDTSAATTTAGGSTATTAGDKVDLSDVPGVTDDEIRFSVLGTRTNNPLGTCILDCFLDGIEAYFAFRNSEGGVHGRNLVVSEDIDDELGAHQAKSLEIISADDTFATFNASTLATGFAEFAKARVPLYVWAIQADQMAGVDSIFGNREPVCITCVKRWIPYVAELAGATKIASLGYGVSDSSKQCAASGAASVERYGSEVGAEVVYVNDDLAFGLPNGVGPEVSAMKEAGVDLVTACVDLNGMKTIAQELQRQGMDDVVLYHTNTYDQAFVQEAGALFEGDYVQTTFRPFEAEAGDSQLGDYKTWMEETGKDLSEPALMGWINADLAYQGILAAGPSFDREKVIAATNAMTDYTAGGLLQPIDWSRQHDRPTDDDLTNAPKYDCVALVQVKDGAFEMVGDPAKPWNCWPGDTSEWSEPVPMDFK